MVSVSSGCFLVLPRASARSEARSCPSATMLWLPSGATSEILANQSVSVAVEAATRCSAIGPSSVSGCDERRRPPGEALLFFEALVERDVRGDRDRALLVEAHRQAGGGVGEVAGARFGRTFRGDRLGRRGTGGGRMSTAAATRSCRRTVRPAARRRARAAGSGLPCPSGSAGRTASPGPRCCRPRAVRRWGRRGTRSLCACTGRR